MSYNTINEKKALGITHKRRISSSMKGMTSNFKGKSHDRKAKKKISIGRGDRDPIGRKRWIVNDGGETLRKKPEDAGHGWKVGKRVWVESFREWLKRGD